MIGRRIGCMMLFLILGPAGLGMAADEELSRIGLAGEVPRTARRLAAADELAAQKKWAEAVDEYHRILTEAGDDLVSLDPRHSLQARRVCHLRLAALPPAALRLYRSRVDSQAKKWLDQGTTGRDPLLLRRLVDETFCSRHTDLALDLLGDLAFERGSFEEAERWWRMLALPASEHGTDPGNRRSARALVFPDPQVDLARVRAKQLLARLFRSERTGLQEEMQAFRALHATANGPLAGRDGVYAEILQMLAGQQESLASPTLETAWPTFGGNASRSGIVPKPPGLWARGRPLDGPQWTVRLDAQGSPATSRTDIEPGNKVVPLSQAARSLAFHPVIDGNRVFVADARRVMGYNLLDGREILRYDLAIHVGQDLRLKLDLPPEPDLSYTLSVAGNRIYARLGAQALGPPRKDGPVDANHSYLACLNLQFDVSGKVERWRVASKGTAATGPVFEGAPVVGHGRVFIAESRFAGGQTQTAIVCYDAGTGQERWHGDICSVTQDFRLEEGKQRVRHHLLTLAGSTLFYCSHSGAIVALDAWTGRRLWAVRYPSQVQQTIFGETPPRDLAPCVYHGCRLYVAPLDSDRLLCLDPDTGRTIWERGRLHVTQMLGVAKGRLIFTATTPRPCIRAVEAATGKDLRDWMQPRDGTELKTFGRGVLAGDWVFWPIRSDWRRGVYVLDQKTGEPILFDEKINGNLAIGGDCLAVAGARELSVYIPEGRLLQRRRQEAAQSLASIKAQYRLALAEAGAGLYPDALANLDRLEAQAAPEDRLNGMALRDLLGVRRHEILLDAAEQAQQAEQWQRAANWLTQAAAQPFPPFARLQALSRQAALWTRAGKPQRARSVWQSIHEDATLRSGVLVSADGQLHAAASLAREQITGVAQQPPSVAAPAALDFRPPELLLPLGRAWQSSTLPTEHEAGEHVVRTVGGPRHHSGNASLFSIRGRTVLCRNGRSGRPCWQCTLPQVPQWMDYDADTVVAAGLDTVYGLSRTDGGQLWSLCLTTDYHAPHLAAFQLAGPRLFFLQDERRLIALDIGSGQLLWSCWAPAGRLQLPFPSGRFRSIYHAGEASVLIQTGMGQWLLLDSRTGDKLRESDRAGPPWPRPPLPLDDHHICLQPDPEHLRLIHSQTGEEIWTYTVESPVSLTGEPLQVLGNRDTLLVLVARNYGSCLECLDARTGRRRWTEARYLGTQPLDLEGGTLDETAAYLVQNYTLQAYDLREGRLLWKRALPAVAVHWQTLRTQHALIAFPRKGRGVQWQLRWLFATAQLRLTFAPADPATRLLPLLVCDLQTGRLVQRLNFPATAPRACWHCRLEPIPVAVPQLGRQRLTLEDTALAVQLSQSGMIVQWEDQAIGVASAPRGLPVHTQPGSPP